ncbi:endonuclease/exonuclease/phosphatase family protein [Pseudopedobacter sp.]|uniref:endonuclease/exonuclease/phosphatase family protein n=1 Tax=Pseudopedobacter sp. TaxID=1936787 RepID=UPI00333F0037
MKINCHQLLVAGIISFSLISCAEPQETEILSLTGLNEKSGAETQALTGTIKVMSYNIHQGIGPAPAKIYNLKKTIQVINESGADVIGLNEVLNKWTSVSNNENQPDSIKKYCTAYPYRIYQASNTQADGGTFGNMVLSKYPIEASYTEIYTDKSPDEGYPYKGFLEVRINKGGNTFHFYVTHLILPTYPTLQTGQINQLIKRSRKVGGPKIVCGDLNILPNSTQHATIAAEFADPLGTSLTPATFSTNGYKNDRLDYILGQKVTFTNVAPKNDALTLIASDHFPLLATATLDFRTFKYMQYNINHGENMNGVYDLQAIANVIKSSNADVIALSQVDRYFSSRSNYDDQIRWLGETLGMYYRYQTVLSYPATTASGGHLRKYGQGFLSKFPFDETQEARYIYTADPGDGNKQGLLRTRVNINGNWVNFYVTSFGSGSTDRLSQATEAKNWINADNVTWKVLGGSLDISRTSAPMVTMYSFLSDAFAGVTAFNYPSNTPVNHLNYILTKNTVTTNSATVINTQASRSRPLTCNIVLN